MRKLPVKISSKETFTRHREFGVHKKLDPLKVAFVGDWMVGVISGNLTSSSGGRVPPVLGGSTSPPVPGGRMTHDDMLPLSTIGGISPLTIHPEPDGGGVMTPPEFDGGSGLHVPVLPVCVDPV